MVIFYLATIEWWVTGRTGWNQCALLLEKSVCGSDPGRFCQVLKQVAPEWGRTKNFLGNWPPNLIHRPSRENQSDFPCLFCGWDLLEISLGNYTSASFWQRVTPTAPFKDWYFRSQYIGDDIDLLVIHEDKGQFLCYVTVVQDPDFVCPADVRAVSTVSLCPCLDELPCIPVLLSTGTTRLFPIPLHPQNRNILDNCFLTSFLKTLDDKK